MMPYERDIILMELSCIDTFLCPILTPLERFFDIRIFFVFGFIWPPLTILIRSCFQGVHQRGKVGTAGVWLGE